MGIIIAFFSDENITTNKNKVEDDYLKPKIYGNLEGPKYTALDYNKTYATRHYEKTLWVSTIVQGTFDDAWKDGVPRLLKYFNGRNQKKWYLPKTCPVLMKKQCHATKSQETNLVTALMESQKVTVSMYISKFFHEDPPGPLDSEVFLEEEYKRINLTGYYNKELNMSNIINIKDELHETLTHHNEQFDDDTFYLALYNIKTSLKKQRYYEIWYKGTKLEENYTSIKTYLEDTSDEESLADGE